MIQDYEDLFHQEFTDVAGADKVFAAWEEIKRVVLMRVLDATVNQLATAQQVTTRQDTLSTWADVARAGRPVIEKQVPKRIDREITIARRECSPLDGEAAKPEKIVAAVNAKLGDGAKGTVVAARKLPSGDIVLTTDSADTKNQLVKETSWAAALGAQARVIRTRFTVMAKHVAKDAINFEDQKTAIAKIMEQNPRIHGVVEILRVGQYKRGVQTGTRAGTIIIDVASPRQANRLIHEGLLLQGMFHDVEVFHRDCLIIRCYQCQQFGHTAKFCRSALRCGFCAGKGHSDDRCPVRSEGGPSRCVNCGGAHPAWAGMCSSMQQSRERAVQAYNNRPTRFAIPKLNPEGPSEDSNSGWITVPMTGKRRGDFEEPPRRGPGRPPGSKNTPVINRERADSRSIQDMFMQQSTTQQELIHNVW